MNFIVTTISIVVLTLGLPAAAHNDNPNTKSCHSSCEGNPPARYKHKHPGGDCEEYKLCPTASLDTPEKKHLTSTQQPLSNDKF